MRIIAILALVTTLLSATGNELVAPTYTGVHYGPHEKQVLNVWLAEGEGPHPVLISIHGGGWLRGSGEHAMREYPFLKRGVSIIAIDYRLAPDHLVPAPLLDAARAVQFVRSKAAEWNLDKNRVALMGHSAGGCTALWLAFHDDLADPDSDDPVARESTKPMCVLANAAQTFIDARMVKEFVGDGALAHGMIWRTVGAASAADAIENYAKYEQLYTEYSPYTHLDADDPPALLWYRGNGTDIHSGRFGIKLFERARELGATVYLMTPGDYLAADFPHKGRWSFVYDRLLGVEE